MNEIELKRGGKTVVFRKDASHFGVRLRDGRAPDEASLQAATGQPLKGVRHVAAVRAAELELFSVDGEADIERTMAPVRASPASSVVTHAYTMDGSSELVIPTGAMTVQFGADVPDDQRESLLAQHGLEIVEDLDFLPNGYTVRLTPSSTQNPLKIAAALQKEPAIVTAEPDLSFRRALRMAIPIDRLYPQQWHLKNRGDQLGLTEGADCKAEEAWEITQGSRDIVVCMIDDGVDLQHPDFASPGKIVAPRDFGQGDSDASPVLSDDNHGTACAGVAVADLNGGDVVGLAPGCALMPVRMSMYLTDDSVVAMFRHAMDHGADVISCSWSAAAPYFVLSTKMNAILTHVATQGRRNGKGCVILFAAGNEYAPLEDVKDGVTYHQGFALHPHVIAVGASNSLDRHSDYSNYGPAIAICAPSSGSPGRRIVTTDRKGRAGYATGDYADDFGGTSSATPLAAGLAALMLSVNPELSSSEVKRLMMETADKIDPEGGQYVDGHSDKYGHGRIHAGRAVRAAAGMRSAGLPSVLAMRHRVQRSLPDRQAVEDVIPFPLAVRPVSIEVSVDIKHTYSGDLRITLQAPGGGSMVVYDREGGGADDVSRTLRSTDDPARFEPLLGSDAQGSWRLRVEDLARQDEGILVEWGIAIGYEGQAQ